ncbi:unnamed protein product [Orchesella dallaii]|uniref:DNA mismatch repair protein S5 domain-containing protein n=1 Tax=Orchesella dallaii TaxID=48710 RepID=A0ABP1RAJ1_9HEXA
MEPDDNHKEDEVEAGLLWEENGTCGNVSTGLGRKAAEVKLLDEHTSSLIRKGQVITKVSDVVRELVENAVDADATIVQVYLFKNGLEKIEVRDNGHGMIPEEMQVAARGGHSSKLQDTSNLSRGTCFGFRGEALNAICSAGNVTVTTKTISSPRATKYQLDALGNITSESHVALSKGTVVTVEKLFANYPVRRQYYQNKSTASNEIKEMEAYLKAVAIGNPKCHLSLHHDSNLAFSKGAVQTIQQALIAVLGHNVAKNMGKCGPVKVSTEEDCEDVDRNIELYLPKKPVDMRTMSFTSNKVSMIFCNRKRVYIREYEKLIHRFVTSVVEKPQPADQRRFPVFVLSITVPPKEADFNRDLDKTKVFLVHKDAIRNSIEEELSKFYSITIEEVENARKNAHLTSPDKTATSKEQKNTNKNQCGGGAVSTVSPTPSISKNMIPPPALTSSSTVVRQNAIQSFLEDIPSTSAAFTKSPSKPNPEPVEVTFPASKPVVEIPTRNDPLLKPINASAIISNFEISIDIDSQITQNGHPNLLQPNEAETQIRNCVQAPSTPRNFEVMPGTNLNDWVEGRMRDKHGNIIENVAIVNQPPEPTLSKSSDYETFRSLVAGNPIRCTGTPTSDSSHEPPQKRARTDTPISRSSFFPPASPSPIYRPPFPTTPSPRPSHRQVTLASLTNWSTPATVFSQTASNAVAGVRLPLTPVCPPITRQSGSQKSDMSPEERVLKTAELWELQQKQRGFTPPSVQPIVQNPPPCPTPSASRRLFALDWKPVKTFLSQPLPRLPPQVIEKLQVSPSVGPVYVTQTIDGIGVFSPTNLVKYFSSEIGYIPSPDCSFDGSTNNIFLSDHQVTSMFAEFVRRPELYNAPEAAKIFHLMQDMPALAKMYNSMSLFHRA